MSDHFELEINYRNTKHLFSGELAMLGYTHKIFMQVNGFDLVFEPDEERNYRVVVAEGQDAAKLDRELVQAILTELENVFK